MTTRLPATVEEIGRIHFEGNIIPHPWYQRITLESGKPDMPAIIILAEILYWYRPIQSLDQSGKPILRKRFDSDMFQCSAAYFEAKFGFTKTQARRAIARLEEGGLIRREFRDVVIQGILRNNITFIEPVPLAIMAITHPPSTVAEMMVSAVSEALPLVSQTPSPVGQTPSPVGQGLSLKSHLSEITTETTTEITTTTPNPSSFTERTAEPETVERGGGVRDENQDSASHHGTAVLEVIEEQPANDEEAANDQRPELAYPAKLTEREREDIAAQVEPLPAEVAQQMLDVIASKMQGAQIKTNPAAVLRGIVRKYRADPESFDPSAGFQVSDIRRRREDAKARQRAEAERREREALRTLAPEAMDARRQAVESMRRALRGAAIS